MNEGLELQPPPPGERRATPLDLLLVFAGANIVTTTLVTGGALGQRVAFPAAFLVLALGLAIGTLPIAWLARLGPRYGLPTMVLLRQVFGTGGAGAIALLLVVTNFAWIALNNVLAARALALLLPGEQPLWTVLSGAAAITLALCGPIAMARFDRVAVPLLALLGGWLTVRVLSLPAPTTPLPAASPLFALDLVIGYQVSWGLMFADYSRYLPCERRAGTAVFLGLGLSSAWLMALGARAGQLAGSADPTAMVLGAGLPVPALLVVALSTLTTNFVNLYLSALAVRSVAATVRPLPTVLVVGLVGTALGLLDQNLLDRYAGFMGLLGTLLLPILAVTVVHFVTRRALATNLPPLVPAAALAWLAGTLTYQAVARAAPGFGATLPTLAVSALFYLALARGRAGAAGPGGAG